jgi:hypothetical protein
MSSRQRQQAPPDFADQRSLGAGHGLPAMLAAVDRRSWLAVMTLLALWFAVHPWRGIWHDGMLYSVQALRRLYPANFAADLYFLHGSQDSFTLFSPLYAAAIAFLGLQGATIALLLAGYVLWAGAAAYLLAAVLRGFYFWLGLAMLVLWPSDYGPSADVFRLAESFLTPRLFAEGLGMLALGCFVRGKVAWGMLPASAALAFHPLLACAPLLAGALFLAWSNWRVALVTLAAAAAVAASLIGAGVPPFGRLLQTMDAEWLALVNERAPMMAWPAWQAAHWISRTAVALCLAATAARLATGHVARLFQSALFAGILGLLASWLGTGISHNLLLIQAQPWRLLWITQLCAWPALAWLLARYWHGGRLMRMLLLALGLAALTRNTLGGAVALAACAALCHLAPRPARPWPAWGNGAALAGLAVLACAWLAEILAVTGHTAAAFPSPGPGWQALLGGSVALKLGGGALAGTLLLVSVWRLGSSTGTGRQRAAFALAFSSLALALAYAAAPYHRAHDLSPAGERAVQAAFLPLLPPQAVLYWQNNVLVSWFVLLRSNYASNAQVTGLSFNRGTAVEGIRRLARLRHLGGEDAVVSLNATQTSLAGRQLAPPSRNGLHYVCADPALDFVVLDTPLGNAAIAQASDTRYGKTYYLFDCARLRGH